MAIVLIFFIVLVATAMVALIRYAKAQRYEQIPPQVRASIEHAEATRLRYHSTLKTHKHEVWVAQHTLQELVDPRGPRAERLPDHIATARVDLSAAMDTAGLIEARQAYSDAVDLMPGEYGGKFATDLEQTKAHRDQPLAWDRLRDVRTPLGLG